MTQEGHRGMDSLWASHLPRLLADDFLTGRPLRLTMAPLHPEQVSRTRRKCNLKPIDIASGAEFLTLHSFPAALSGGVAAVVQGDFGPSYRSSSLRARCSRAVTHQHGEGEGIRHP